MDFSSLGKLVLLVGVALIVVGGLMWMLGQTGLPLGQLPGNIRIQRGNVSCFIPIVSMILLSVILTIILNVVIRLLNR
jgi:hypothetical protein